MIAALWFAAKALAARLAAALWGWLRRDPVLFALALVAVVAFALSLDVMRWKRRYAGAQLVALNAIAARDTSEAVRGLDSTKLATATRQAVQLRLERDSLDQLLHLTTVAKARVEIVMPPTTIHAAADSATRSDSGRAIAFHLRSAPYTADADVVVPDDTAHAPTIRLRLAVDTAGLWTRVGCVGDTARVLFTAPPWLRLRVTDAEQEPGVCQHVAPAVAERPSHAKRNAVVLTGATILGGVLQHNLPLWLGRRRSPVPALVPSSPAR